MKPYRPYARAHLIRALIFVCQSRVALKNGGWIGNAAMNDILDETGASAGMLDNLVKVELVEKRRRHHPISKQWTSEWRATEVAKDWLAKQKLGPDFDGF